MTLKLIDRLQFEALRPVAMVRVSTIKPILIDLQQDIIFFDGRQLTGGFLSFVPHESFRGQLIGWSRASYMELVSDAPYTLCCVSGVHSSPPPGRIFYQTR